MIESKFSSRQSHGLTSYLILLVQGHTIKLRMMVVVVVVMVEVQNIGKASSGQRLVRSLSDTSAGQWSIANLIHVTAVLLPPPSCYQHHREQSK